MSDKDSEDKIGSPRAEPAAPTTDPAAPETSIVLRSATPSESSPSKPFPHLEALALPEWGEGQDAVSWFLQFRKAIKSLIYRYCATIQKALLIFEENDATSYRHYGCLSWFLSNLWTRWKEFRDTKHITTTFLSSSVIYDDFFAPLPWMTTPRNAPHRFSIAMAELRRTTRQTAIQFFENSGLVKDAMARLAEANDGHDTPPFEGFPAACERDDPADQVAMISLANSRPQSPSTESEYADSDEELVASRGIKDHDLLGHKGFEPIWMREFGYPGTPPPELEEFLDPEVTRTKQMIGSIRSIFWLYGYKDLVELVDDPAYSLQDEIVAVPQGVRVVDFLLDRYWEEGKIPRYISETYEGVRWPRSFRVMPVFAIPERVTEAATMHHITDLYPYARAQFFPDNVLCLKLKSHKKATKTIAQAEKKLAGVFDLDNETLWFRGLSLRALALSMSFFLPTIHPHSGDNELGPGLYVAKDFATAADYAHPNGAIMVFRDPDFNDLNVWRPDRSDWESLTAHWLQIPLRDLKTPQGYKTADFIIGAISESESRSMSRKSFAIPGERLQMACTSYDACKRLAASLVAIIYLSS